MKFGRRLEQDMVQDFKPHYLQYKLLKKEIKALEEQVQQPAGATDPTADESANGLLINQQITYQEFAFPGPKAHRYAILASFKPMLDAEVEKVNAFVISKVKELENRVLQLLRTSQPWKDAFGPGSSSSSQAEASDRRLSGSDIHEGQLFLEQLREEAKQIAEDLVNLDKFIRQNIIAVQKIIKKFDKRLNFDVAPWLNAQLMESTPFLKVNLDSVLIALSDAYERISGFENEFKLLTAPPKKLDPEEDAKKGISAQSFERKTTKYWVRAENLMAVKIAIIQVLIYSTTSHGIIIDHVRICPYTCLIARWTRNQRTFCPLLMNCMAPWWIAPPSLRFISTTTIWEFTTLVLSAMKGHSCFVCAGMAMPSPCRIRNTSSWSARVLSHGFSDRHTDWVCSAS